MTKKLILARHSYAENGSFKLNDFDRALTNTGIQHVQNQSILLSEQINKIDCLISSDAKRAIQTADIIRKQLNYSKPVQYEHFLYTEYTTKDFINFVNKFDDNLKYVTIVGHNPTIAKIAYRLASNFMHSVSPGTIIIMEFNNSSWESIQVGDGKLKMILA